MSKIELGVILCRLCKLSEQITNETATKDETASELDEIINELERVKQFLPAKA